jgi:hypothetical protein
MQSKGTKNTKQLTGNVPKLYLLNDLFSSFNTNTTSTFNTKIWEDMEMKHNDYTAPNN